jgi:hypothetical protein
MYETRLIIPNVQNKMEGRGRFQVDGTASNNQWVLSTYH